jgi:multicomponent Na+:H+ antiporter subunit G
METVLDILSWLLLLSGGFFCITAGVGLIRMPDFFTRAHAASILDSMGAGLILLGLALQAPDYLVAIKLLFTFFFLMITGLAAVHALAQTVNVAGINPRLANIVKRLDKNADSEYPDTTEKPADSSQQS